MPKMTHTIVVHDGGKNPLGGAPTAVYGKTDLETRLDAAKDAGVKVTVREADDS